MAPTVSPGITPARNRSDTEAPAAWAYRIKGIEGGMMTPSPPDTATRATVNFFVITHFQHYGNGHGTDGRHRGGRGTGNGTEEKAGGDHGAGDTGGQITDEIREYIKDLFGNAASCHDDAGKHEQRNGQKGRLVDAAQHGTGDIDAGDRKGLCQQRRQHGRNADRDTDRDGDHQQDDKNYHD